MEVEAIISFLPYYQNIIKTIKMKTINLFYCLSICLLCFFITGCKDKGEPINNAIVFNPNLTYGTVIDNSGIVYKTITIGTQTWMAENLKTTKYRNGDSILNVKSNAVWDTLTIGAQCTYNNTLNKDSILKFGRLYNWYAVNDSRNIAPAGWHVPSDAEWQILRNYLSTASYNTPSGDSTDNIVKSLAATTDWIYNSSPGSIGYKLSANNNSGFTAIPSGYRTYYGLFEGIGIGAYYFGIGTNSQYSKAYYLGLVNSINYIGNWGYGGIEGNGNSIRCVKD